MKRFKVIGRGYIKIKYPWIIEENRILVLLDKKTKRIVKLEDVREGGYGYFRERIYISINSMEPKIVFDPIERIVKYNIYPNTRGQRRKAFARLCRTLGISKKELATYLGLVSLFDKA